MAASTSRAAASTYHVFLSFRGGDTRKNFTDHLYTALVQAGIHTFRDDDEIPRGENVELTIKRAIKESRLSIIVLSKDYASSRWCLDELVMIMERKRLVGHVVFPVYYGVDPSQVKEQTGSFGDAFIRHEECFKKDMETVEGWRSALREVADLEHIVIRDGYMSQFIQNIVKEVENKLSRTILNVAPYLVGIDSQAEAIDMWLQNEKDVGIAIIYGIGGIGKTTIAKRLYNLNFNKFEARSFLANIREYSEQPNGLVRLQRRLLSDLLKQKANKIYNVDEGINKIKDAIRGKRVLLILDDVDQSDQLNSIIGMQEWLHPGSKIIITTRQNRLPGALHVSLMFRLRELDCKESLDLFCWHAFDQHHPLHNYEQLAENLVHHCGGLPLALQVLGSSLNGKTVDIWESTLQKLGRIPDREIQNILGISYESLQDDHDKSLFLDIACFFNGMNIHYIVRILEGCNFYAITGIQNLINRCLITITEENKLTMHQLLIEMGREIVHRESPDHPGKCSRLWDRKDAITVLKDNTGTESIRGLSFKLPTMIEDKAVKMPASENHAKRHLGDGSNDKLMPLHQGGGSKRHCLGFFTWRSADSASFSTKSFANMRRLKLLHLNDVNLDGGFKDFPKGLVWLRWHGFPLNSIPTDFFLEKLVVLDMRYSNLKHTWKGIRFYPEMKILNLSHSHNLIRTPNFNGLPNLQRLVLKSCINLVEVDESIGDLKRLVLLNLKDCKSLKKLPERINMLRSLEELDVSGCLDLMELPEELGQLESLMVLLADGTSANNVNSSSKDSNKLSLQLWNSTFWSSQLSRRHAQSTHFSLAFLPRCLMILSLSDSNLSDSSMPKDLSHLPFLQHLNLSGNQIHFLPEINSLSLLESLVLDRCMVLQSLPELPANLDVLKAEDCTSLQRITNLPNLFESLDLEIYGCDKLNEIQGLYKLESIKNVDTEMLNNLGLFNLESLESIEMDMSNAFSSTEMRTTIQALHECGICSIFLPGNEVPDWFKDQNEGSSISFEVPTSPNHKLHGLSLCIVYACTDEAGVAVGFYSDENYIKIHNKTNGTKWTYSPAFYGIPKANNKDMIWLSHWVFGDQLEAGDQVDISVAMASAFHVQECGIRVIYDENEKHKKGKEIVESSSSCGNTDLYSAYELVPSMYFLCNHNFLTHQGAWREDSRGDPSGYEYLFDQNHGIGGDWDYDSSEYEEYYSDSENSEI